MDMVISYGLMKIRSRPFDYYYANGLFGQYIFIVPKLNIMAVVKSHLQDEQQSAPRLFFEELLGNWLEDRTFECSNSLTN